MLKIGILASGGLGLKAVKHLNQSQHELICVLTDKGSSEIIAYCEYENIPFSAGNPRNGIGYSFIKNFQIEVLASINYLFLIESDLIQHPTGIAFNIHGSLLPKYRGRTPHVWAIINGEKETGITAHFIDPNCDTGAIIKQIIVPIGNEETGADILKKYNELYLPLLDYIFEKYLEKDIQPLAQDESKATFFEKRTPDSGHIDWSWTSERIRNWVRAQASPYPGAFGFINGNRIIIDKVKKTFDPLPIENIPGRIEKKGDRWLCAAGDGYLELVSVRNRTELLEATKIIE